MDVTEEKHRIILENLFYLLSGFDTTHIKVGVKDKRYALVADQTYPLQLVLPFESLAVNIRIFSKFILKSRYCSDAMKRILSSHLESKVQCYLRELILHRRNITRIEMLAVQLKDYVGEFSEMREVMDNIRDMEGVEIMNHLKKRRDRNIHFAKFYDAILSSCTESVWKDVRAWVMDGIVLSSGFMVRKNECLEGFDESAWTHGYGIDKAKLPYFLVQDKDVIYDSGRIVNIWKRIFGRGLPREFVEEYKCLGLTTLNCHLNNLLLESLRSDLEKEFDTVHKYILLSDPSFYFDIFEELGCEVFFPTEKTIVKINSIVGSKSVENVRFKTSAVSLSEYVLKILNVQMQCPVYGAHPSILQSLICDYNPVVLGNFLSKKTFSELEIMFRFLFTVTGLSYYMERFKTFRIARIATLIMNNFRFEVHSRINPTNISGCMNRVIEDFLSNIGKWLRMLCLTNEKAYQVWDMLFDLCYEFLSVEYKEAIGREKNLELEKRLMCIISKFKNVPLYDEHNRLFVNFLERTDWSHVLENL